MEITIIPVFNKGLVSHFAISLLIAVFNVPRGLILGHS